jgi:hypothetical protein
MPIWLSSTPVRLSGRLLKSIEQILLEDDLP